MKSQITRACFSFILLLFGVACGVKGDPLPPEQAPRLGRGYPTYTKASERLTPDFSQPKKDSEEKDDEE